MATHIGSQPVTLVIKQEESNLATGKVTFRSSWSGQVGFYYIVVFN